MARKATSKAKPQGTLAALFDPPKPAPAPPKSALVFEAPAPTAPTANTSPPTDPTPEPSPVRAPEPPRTRWIMSMWRFISERAGIDKALSDAPETLATRWPLILNSISQVSRWEPLAEFAKHAEVAAMRCDASASMRDDPHMGSRETALRVAAAIMHWLGAGRDGDAPLPTMRLVKNLLSRSVDRAILTAQPMPSDASLVIRTRMWDRT